MRGKNGEHGLQEKARKTEKERERVRDVGEKEYRHWQEKTGGGR